MSNPEFRKNRPERNNLYAESVEKIEVILDKFYEGIKKDDLEKPEISKIVNKLLNMHSSFIFEEMSVEMKQNFMVGIKYFTNREFTSRILNQLNQAIKINEPKEIRFSILNEGRLGLGNIVNCFVDPTREMGDEFEAGIKDGVLNVLNLIQGDGYLQVYTRNLIERSRFPHRTSKYGVKFYLPTALPNVKVGYFYPHHENQPDLSIVVKAL